MGHLYIAGKKMSKSLKNFISIQEYLNHGYGSNAPATDFRLMCLFHKYHNPISFSSSLLEEGQAFRAKVIHLLNFISTFMKTYHSLNNVPNSNFIYDSDIDSSRKSSFAISKKPTAESKKFQSQMYDIQKDIRNHLCDDINTPQVMRALVNLINNAEQYGNLTLSSLSNNNLRYDKTNVITNSTTIQNQQHPIEPLLDAKDYMLHMISIFGLKINDFAGETFTYDIIQDEVSI
jgi:cysteinyl-tRNA synthetase